MSANPTEPQLPPEITELRELLKANGQYYGQDLLARIEQQFSESAATIQQKQEAVDASEHRWVLFQLRNDLESEFVKAGGYQGEFSFLEPWATGRIKIDSAGKQKFFDKDGKPDESVESIAQLIQKIVIERPGVAKHFGNLETNAAPAGDGTKPAPSAWDAVEKSRASHMQQENQDGRSQPTANSPELQGLSAWERVDRLRSLPRSLQNN
jgi:hypothetical protein